MFEYRFLCPKNVKEMEKRRVRGAKTGFGVEKNGLEALFFIIVFK